MKGKEQGRKGGFIVFEGIDGSGKSTQIRMTADRLRDPGQPVHTTFEPTNGLVGKLIRQMLAGTVRADQRALACLFAADRTDHLVNENNGLRKKVAEGNLVLCDRYYFSSYAYHSQYVDMDWVITVNSLNAAILKPDLTIFIDVAPETCFERIKGNRGRFDMYEHLEIMKKVRAQYFKAFDRLRETERIVVVDGNQSMERVGEVIFQEIRKILRQV